MAYRTGGGRSADRPPEVSLLFGTLTLMSRLESRLNVSVRLAPRRGSCERRAFLHKGNPLSHNLRCDLRSNQEQRALAGTAIKQVRRAPSRFLLR